MSTLPPTLTWGELSSQVETEAFQLPLFWLRIKALLKRLPAARCRKPGDRQCRAVGGVCDQPCKVETPQQPLTSAALLTSTRPVGPAFLPAPSYHLFIPGGTHPMTPLFSVP